MASYKVILKPSFEKDLRSIPKSVITRVINSLDLLAENPFPRQALKLEGGGQLYRVREWETIVSCMESISRPNKCLFIMCAIVERFIASNKALEIILALPN